MPQCLAEIVSVDQDAFRVKAAEQLASFGSAGHPGRTGGVDYGQFGVMGLQPETAGALPIGEQARFRELEAGGHGWNVDWLKVSLD